MVKTVPDGRMARTGVVLREDDSKVGGRKLTGVHAAAAARAATENEQTSFSIKHISNSSKLKSFYSTYFDDRNSFTVPLCKRCSLQPSYPCSWCEDTVRSQSKSMKEAGPQRLLHPPFTRIRGSSVYF